MSSTLRKNLIIFVTDIIVWVLAMILYVVLRFVHTSENILQDFESNIDLGFYLRLGIQAGLILGAGIRAGGYSVGSKMVKKKIVWINSDN